MDLLKRMADRPVLAAAIIIGLGTLARIWFVASGQLDLVQDEAQYWDWTRHLQLTYYSKGPLIAWIIAAWTKVFGQTELGVRFGSIAGAAIGQAILFYGVANVFKRPVAGLWTLFIVNTSPLFMALGILMTTDNAFVLTWTGAMFALYAGSVPDGRGRAPAAPFAWLAFFFAVGVLAKYTMLGFCGLAVLYAAALWRLKQLPPGFVPKMLSALAVGLALGFLPTFIWNFQNDWVGYKHVFHLIGVSGKAASTLIRFDRFPEYFGSQVGFMTPWWFVFMLVGGVGAARAALGRKGLGLGLDRRQAWLLSLFFWPMWLFFMLWSFHTKVMPNWSTVSHVAGAILAALAFERLWNFSSSKWARYKKVWVGAGLATFVILNSVAFIPMPDNLNPTHRLKGWQDLGQEVARVMNEDFPDPGKVFIFSEQYDMTAALAFYVPGQPRTYCVWLDRRMNQYDMWPGPRDKIGWNAVYVRKRFRNKLEEGVEDMFRRISDPIHYQTTHNGAPARKFTLFLCYGYNGHWPRDDQGDF